MTIILSEDQSLEYLSGGWEQYRVEEDILDDLMLRHRTEPVAVVLSDESAVACYIGMGHIL